MESTVRLSTTNNAKIIDQGVVSTDLIDFIIPAGETYNLSKSYVAMNMRINAPSDGTISDFVLTSKKPAKAANYNRVSPSLVHMVKNVNVFAERTGKIEDIRAVNLLRGVLNNYTDGRDREEKMSRPFAVRDNSFTYCNPFVLKKKLGSDLSEYKEVEMQIPLKDLLNIGNVEAYSTAKYGQTHIHMELDNNLEFIQSQGNSNDVTLDGGGGSADITALTGVLGNTTYWDADQSNSVPNNAKFNAGTFTSVSGDLVSKWTSDRVYNDMKLSPFWVSQQIEIPTVATRPTGDFKLTIDSIAQTAAGKVELTFAVPHSDLITQTVTKTGDVTNEISLAVSSFAAGSIAAGDKVSGTGIPADTAVKSVKTLVTSGVLHAETASGNAVLTFVSALAGAAVGNKVFGLNIPDGTTISSVTGAAYTMSNNATAAIPVGTRIAFTNDTDSTDNIIISKAADVTDTTAIKVSHTINQGDAATVKGVDAAATLSIDPPRVGALQERGCEGAGPNQLHDLLHGGGHDQQGIEPAEVVSGEPGGHQLHHRGPERQQPTELVVPIARQVSHSRGQQGLAGPGLPEQLGPLLRLRPPRLAEHG